MATLPVKSHLSNETFLRLLKFAESKVKQPEKRKQTDQNVF